MSEALYALADPGSVVIAASPDEPRAQLAASRGPRHDRGRGPACCRASPSSSQRVGADLPSSLAIVSGPSRSADIEQVLALGVHGPREEHVVIVPPKRRRRGRISSGRRTALSRSISVGADLIRPERAATLRLRGCPLAQPLRESLEPPAPGERRGAGPVGLDVGQRPGAARRPAASRSRRYRRRSSACGGEAAGGERGVERPVLAEYRRRLRRPDPGGAGDTVGRVAAQRDEVGDLGRLDAVALADLGRVRRARARRRRASACRIVTESLASWNESRSLVTTRACPPRSVSTRAAAARKSSAS